MVSHSSNQGVHVYEIVTRSWWCNRCGTDCGRDDMPCPCCFDGLPVVSFSDGTGEVAVGRNQW